MEIVGAVLIGAIVGLLLGLIGGGGAVLIVPSMVYILHVDAHVALATALVIVGVNALIGGVMAWRAGRTHITTALPFGMAGIVTAYLGARISRLIPGDILLIAFSCMLLVIARVMYQGNNTPQQVATQARPLWHVLLIGSSVGLVTGILGVGGGFLIVPAMVLLVGMPMSEAVGTSLIVIAINSGASMLGHLDTPLDWTLIMWLLVGAIPSILISSRISPHISPKRLRYAFAIFVSVVAVIMLVENAWGRFVG